MTPDMRIGTGFDVHPFVEHKELYLGGVKIEHPKGLKGHSDADVLLHAITDAVIGALGWGDLGTWFPDSDQEYQGTRSTKLFRAVWDRAQAEGWKLINCDTVVLAEKPKLKPYVETIRNSVAELFDSSQEQVNIKATTMEQLGFIGREEGMAATAVVLLSKDD